MTKTIKFEGMEPVQLEMTVGAGLDGGALYAITEMVVYLLNDADADNKATVRLPGVHTVIEHSVVANNNGTVVSAVAIGNRLYLDGTVVNKDSTDGIFIGYALGTVASAGTAGIKVGLV